MTTSILKDGWKLIRLFAKDSTKTRYELYNLDQDPTERFDLSTKHPEKVSEYIKIMDSARTPNEKEYFNF